MVSAIDSYSDFKDATVNIKTVISDMNKGGKLKENFLNNLYKNKGGGGEILKLDDLIKNALPVLKGGYKKHKEQKIKNGGGCDDIFELPYNIFSDKASNNDLYNTYVRPTYNTSDMSFKSYDYPQSLTPQRDIF